MSNGLLLWVDDEIELLKAHILFLQKKDYEVMTATNGRDAIDSCREHSFDLIMLDENMPGLSGLETLSHIKEIDPNVPVVMVTKSEEENIMDQAIGSKIADYLIKPVNPNQILLTLKKNIHRREIVTEVAQTGYQQNFGKIGMQINDSLTYSDWIEVYKRLVFWELELSGTDSDMTRDALHAEGGRQQCLRQIYPPQLCGLDKECRQPSCHESRHLQTEDISSAQCRREGISHRARQLPLRPVAYAQLAARRLVHHRRTSLLQHPAHRDAICPQRHILRPYAQQDSGDVSGPVGRRRRGGGQESQRGTAHKDTARPLPSSIHLSRTTKSTTRWRRNASCHSFKQLEQNDLNVVVLNFIDMLSHARTESKMVRELAATEAAYRSITLSWFQHSAVKELFKRLAASNYKIVITTDHGSIRVTSPSK
jgi:CheY-like chemotaxis protein